MKPCFFHIQYFSLHRKDGLEAPVAALLRAASCGVSFHHEEFAMFWIVDGAVCKFSRKPAGIEYAFAARQVARFPRSFPCFRRMKAFFYDSFCIRRVLFQPVHQLRTDDRFDDAFYFAVAEFRFCLSFELRLRNLHAQNGRQPFAEIVSRQLNFIVFNETVFRCEVVERPCQRSSETDKMRASFMCVDIIDIGKNIFVILVVILERDFHFDHSAVFVFIFSLCHDDLFGQCRTRCIDVLDKLSKTALKMKFLFNLRFCSQVFNAQSNTRVEECKFAQALRNGIKFKNAVFKNRSVRNKSRFCARFSCFRFSDELDRRDGIPFFIFLIKYFSVPVDFDLEPFAERIDDRNAYAVKPARNFVRVLVEFSACVEDGHNHLERRSIFLFLNVGRNSPPVVFNADGSVGIDGHIDIRAIACKSFVDGVVHNFIDKVMQPPDADVADIHRRPSAHGFESFENGNIGCGVTAGCRFFMYFLFFFFCHLFLFSLFIET